MYQNVVPVQVQRHGALRVKEMNRYTFAERFHIAYVTQQEFMRASGYYPIVFIEDKPGNAYRPVVLMGLQEGENLFVDQEGKWQAGYIPAIIRRYPFVLTAAGNDQFVICVDESSALLSQSEGVALFDAQGQPAPAMENVKRYLAELFQLEQLTILFSRLLAEMNLLVPLQLRLSDSDRQHTIAGCFVIGEARLQALAAEQFLLLREKNYLTAIYAHLCSLQQVERLTLLRQERQAKEPVAPLPQESTTVSEVITAAVATKPPAAPVAAPVAAEAPAKRTASKTTTARTTAAATAKGEAAVPAKAVAVSKTAEETAVKPARSSKKKISS
ncbi:MAG: SapC family protein [Magnetococcales bacterium]|nr:SapC family protein [Magnetococcales bacterium]